MQTTTTTQDLKLTYLHSVGCLIDLYGNTYAAYTDGTPDLNSIMHVSECSDEWQNNLSKQDKETINNILNNQK